MAAPIVSACRQPIVCCKTLSHLRRCIGSSAAWNHRLKEQSVKSSQSVSFSEPNKIVIPKRKKRDALSILKALSSTVGKDYTAPHYKYMDDPYLMPADNLNKKSYTLSKASGRKAAKYLFKTYSNLFEEMYDFAEPKVEAFQPTQTTYEHTEATEAALVERIQKRAVTDAIEVYKTIKREDGELSQSVCEALLDLLCVYNGAEVPEPLEMEEIWYKRDFEPDRTNRPSWQTGCMAEQVFEDLPEKVPSAYCSLIKGLAKYNQIDKAYQLYYEMMDKKLPVSLDTYNYLLRVAGFLRDNLDSKWQLILRLLTDLRDAGMKPDLLTFNGVLHSLSKMTKFRKAHGLSLQTLVEMKACGVEPSLASWHSILCIFYSTEESQDPILVDIIKYLQGKEFTLQDPFDMEFFPTAMGKCFNNLHDVEVAYKLDDLINTGENSRFLADGIKEGIYYSNFFRLLCMMENLDKIMEYYEKIAPYMWTPTFSAIEELLKAIDLHEGYQHLPHIWSDLVLFEYTRRADLLEALIGLMVKKRQPPQLQTQFAEVSRVIRQKWLDDQERGMMRGMELSGSVMSQLITICLRAEDFDLAWDHFDTYQSQSRKFSGLPSGAAITELLDACVKQKDKDKAKQCVTLMTDLSLPGAEEAKEKVTNMTP